MPVSRPIFLILPIELLLNTLFLLPATSFLQILSQTPLINLSIILLSNFSQVNVPKSSAIRPKWPPEVVPAYIGFLSFNLSVIEFGLKSKTFLIRCSNFLFEYSELSKEFIVILTFTGSATPIAYDICISHFLQV